jgi:hypothetical protein
MAIVATDSIASFFDEIVVDALKARHVEASQSAARYLVGVLSDYAHPEGLGAFGRPLALSLQEALVTSAPAERFERLRQLGDAVLYASGFFADHFAARGIENRYVFSIGSRAYVSAGAMLRMTSSSSLDEQASSIDLFDELASRFDEFSSVVGEVANITLASGATGPKGLLKLYERWMKTGSETVGDALASHGIFPTRKAKGLQ